MMNGVEISTTASVGGNRTTQKKRKKAGKTIAKLAYSV